MPDPPLGFYPLELFPLITVVVSLDTPGPLDVTTLYQVALVKLFPVSFDAWTSTITSKRLLLKHRKAWSDDYSRRNVHHFIKIIHGIESEDPISCMSSRTISIQSRKIEFQWPSCFVINSLSLFQALPSLMVKYPRVKHHLVEMGHTLAWTRRLTPKHGAFNVTASSILLNWTLWWPRLLLEPNSPSHVILSYNLIKWKSITRSLQSKDLCGWMADFQITILWNKMWKIKSKDFIIPINRTTLDIFPREGVVECFLSMTDSVYFISKQKHNEYWMFHPSFHSNPKIFVVKWLASPLPFCHALVLWIKSEDSISRTWNTLRSSPKEQTVRVSRDELPYSTISDAMNWIRRSNYVQKNQIFCGLFPKELTTKMSGSHTK